MANGQMRHRAYAAPPGGRTSIQEHLNIWGPTFGRQNIDNARRYRSEMHRQYTGTQLPVPAKNSVAPTAKVVSLHQPTGGFLKLQQRRPSLRPQSAAPRLQPSYMAPIGQSSRRSSRTSQDMEAWKEE
jgi:hypothetical protein